MTDKLSLKAADNVRFARSQTLVELVDGTYNIIRLPRYAFVDQIWCEVTQAYAGGAGATGSIGFTGNGETADPDGFMDTTYLTVRSTGMYVMTADAQPGSQGKWFNDAGGMITITLSDGTDTTLMIGTVFARYYIIH